MDNIEAVDIRRIIFPLLLLSFFAFAFFLTPFPEDNINSRLNLTAALAANRNVVIDRYAQNTIDRAYHNGHYYSDKAPGTSIMALPAALILKHFINPDPGDSCFRYILTLLIVSVPAAILILILSHLLARVVVSERDVLLCAVALATGTIFLFYSSLFYGHVPAAVMSFLLFYIAVDKKRLSPARLFFSGLIMGWMVVTEYPLSIHAIVLSAFFYFRVAKKQRLLALVPAIAIATVFLGYYNWFSFGKIVSIGYLSESHPVFSNALSKGFVGITHPQMSSLYLILFKPGRGLFFLSPFLLFSIYGFFAALKNERWRGPAIAAVIIAVSGIIVNGAQPFAGGGMSAGPRHLVPILPYLVFLCSFAFMQPGTTRRGIFTGLVLISSIAHIIINATNPQPLDGIDAPFVEYAWPVWANRVFRPGFWEGSHLYSFNYSGIIYAAVILVLTGIAWHRAKSVSSGQRVRAFQISVLCAALLAIAIQIGGALPVTRQNTAHKHYLLGQDFRRAGQYELARHEYEIALSQNPYHPFALFGLGMIEQETKNPAAALVYFQKAVDYSPHFKEAQFNLARLLMASGRDEPAFYHFSKVLEIDGTDDKIRNSQACSAMGMIRLREKRVDEARSLFLKAIEYNPNSRRALNGLKSIDGADGRGKKDNKK
jgi:Flp pilus assembly protein TadD